MHSPPDIFTAAPAAESEHPQSHRRLLHVEAQTSMRVTCLSYRVCVVAAPAALLLPQVHTALLTNATYSTNNPNSSRLTS
jgi:hypothetical protein